MRSGRAQAKILRRCTELLFHHRLAAERFMQAGGGVAWSPSERANAYLLYRQSLSGANKRKVNNGFTLGYDYSFHLGF